jgi:hypothetical protein
VLKAKGAPGLFNSPNVTDIQWISREQALDGDLVRAAIKPAASVVDVGSGINPQSFVRARVHICVDPFLPYLERLRQDFGNDRFVLLHATWDKVLPLLPDASIDSVFALDLIEHLETAEARRLLEEMVRVARTQVVIFTPLGFYPQAYGPGDTDRWGMTGSAWQVHHSGWKPDDFPDWKIFACREYHLVDQHEERLAEPVGAFWAIRDLDTEAPSTCSAPAC